MERGMDLRVEAVGSPKAACAQLIAWLATLPADLTRRRLSWCRVKTWPTRCVAACAVKSSDRVC